MTNDTPVELIEDQVTGNRFLVYNSESGLRIDVRYEGDALWMTQAQIAQLFGREVSSVSRHISNILDEGELEESTSLQKLQKSVGRPLTLYSLDMVISVGYRVDSKPATQFRKWATQTLVEFATKGFVVDKIRLKEPENADRIRELREVVKDIRSDEANVYRELLRICAMCSDYEGGSSQAIEFFKKMQSKLIFAVVSNTPAEVIKGRADAQEPNMGLQTWPNENIRKADVTVSKNYLASGELRELNSLTTILLDVFDLQFEAGRLVQMLDAEKLLDRQINGLDRVVLQNAGSISKKTADIFAHKQYEQWKEQQKALRHRQADSIIKEIAKEVKDLPKR